jgi:hypothetical protein
VMEVTIWVMEVTIGVIERNRGMFNVPALCTRLDNPLPCRLIEAYKSTSALWNK